MKYAKRILMFVLALLTVFSASLSVSADNNVPYSTYSYNYEGESVESPHAYVPEKRIDGANLGIGKLANPQDLCVDKDGRIYIADTDNARVVVTSADRSSAQAISSFQFEGKEYALTKPTGVFVTEDGKLYVADSTGLKIYVFDRDLTCVQVVERPVSGLLPHDFSYIPTKLSVDKAGRIYIVSVGNTYGVVALNPDGEFSTFIGAQKVTVSVADRIWRRFMTEEQKKRTLSYVPTNYNNIAIDEKGFLYVTSTYSDVNAVIQTIQSRSTENRFAMIKKLNSAGEDVLIRNGAFPPAGDVEISMATGGNATNTDIFYGPSSIMDAAVGYNGVYSLADQKRGKIFTYDENGNLLYAYGGTGYQFGLFRQLSAIEYDTDMNMYALDAAAGSITVFEKTNYGALVLNAIQLSADREYEQLVGVYKKILLENANFDLANIGIGTALRRQGKYKEAMGYFELANDVEDYSEAYSEYRREKLGNYILLVPVLAVLLCYLISRFFKFAKKFNSAVPSTVTGKRPLRQEIMFAFYVIFHPFDGYWELKRSKRGGVRGATVILALAAVSLLFRTVGMGYIYTGRQNVDTNIFANLMVIIGVVAVWCIANWCLTSLMYGEGGLKDIYVATCYALVPLVFFTVPATILSNFVTANELMFVNFFFTVGYLWTGFLLFCSVLSTHDYQLGKNVIAVILTVVGMLIIVFLGLLFVNLIGQMGSMLKNIYNEITFRM
ncbi:MAG: YIP1 family protein [Clostridia bacterium]|nr:YIP1 family protein [Clostridia bacterium]